MIDEWTTRTLGSMLNGGIRHGVYKPLESFGSGTRVLKMGLQYSEDRIGAQEMSRVLLSDDELKRFQAREGDILFSRTSMMSDGAGKCSLVVAHEEPFAFDGNILCGTPDTNFIDAAFVYFFFKSPAGKQAISEIIAGTQSRSLSGTNLAAVNVLCPPLAEQRAIVRILGTLDGKIELNRRMNKTLEAMARALFKSWFVDFEPVRAKAEGRDVGLPKPLADLFPDSFEDSELELGQIPKGWRISSIGDHMCNFDSKRVPVSGGARAKRQGQYPYHGAAGVMDHVDDYLFDGIYLLVGEDGSVVQSNGMAVTQYVWGKLWVNNHAHVLQGKSAVSTEQLYLYFHFESVVPYVTGAVQPKLSQGRMNTYAVCVRWH